jgi:recombination protein RecA
MADKVMTPEEFYKRLSKDDKKAVKDLSEQSKIDFIPTGSWVLNSMIGDGSGTYKPGGFPRGHIVECFGNESCGKTTLGISACKETQEMGGLPIWLDFERTFSKDYAKKLGLNISSNKMVFMVPDNFEHGVRLLCDAFAMRPWLIVVDSVAAMIPRQFLEGAIDEMTRIGLQAQLMSISLNYLTKHIGDNNSCLFFTNQLRSVIKKSQYDPGPDEESSGGRALKYYASLRLKMRTSTIEKLPAKSRITGKMEKEPVNVMVKVSVVKNKIDKPYLSGPVYIRFGEGFDNIASIVELAINTNVIKKAGAALRFDLNGTPVFNANGKENLRALLEENPEMLKTLTGSLVFKEDEQTKLEIPIEDGEEPPVDDIRDPKDLNDLLNQASRTYVEGKKGKGKK